MAFGYHHWHKRQKKNKVVKDGLHSDKTKRVLDTFIYVASFLSILANLPQLLEIWVNHHTVGVSLISWGAFFVSSIFWAFYGYVHKSTSIIILNCTLALMQLFIVIGILIRP